MSRSAKSILVYGVYLVLVGIANIFAPNEFLYLLQIPASTDIWIHVLGVAMVYVGIYYIVAAVGENRPFFRWTVYYRATVLPVLVLFVAFGYVGAGILIVGGIDLVGAAWTWLVLQSDNSLVPFARRRTA